MNHWVKVFTAADPITITRVRFQEPSMPEPIDIPVDPSFQCAAHLEYAAVARELPDGWRASISLADEHPWLARRIAIRPFRQEIIAALKAKGEGEDDCV